MPVQHHAFSHHKNQKAIILVLLAGLILSACSARSSFSGQETLEYGDLRVSVTETGYDRVRNGFVCDNTGYGHPYATLSFECTAEADSDCGISILVEVKYTNGASWGLGYFSTSDSSYLPVNLSLDPGESTEVTFENSATGTQCWSKSEEIKKITISLRDRSGELKDLSARYAP
jgi:hypothetical protein